MNLIIVLAERYWQQAGEEAEQTIQDPDYAIFKPALYILQEKCPAAVLTGQQLYLSPSAQAWEEEYPSPPGKSSVSASSLSGSDSSMSDSFVSDSCWRDPCWRDSFSSFMPKEKQKEKEKEKQQAAKDIKSFFSRIILTDRRQLVAALYQASDEALILCDLPALAGELSERGFPVVGYLHPGVDGAAFRKAPYILSEIDELEPDTYIKIFQRLHHLPWTILQTERCIVREMITDDLPDIYRLYDDSQAERFLEGPDPDPVREKASLAAYIDRVYPLYGYGYWVIVQKPGDPGQVNMAAPGAGGLIGRVGFEPYQGKSQDVSFGYLIRADCRHQGFAQEVCSAVLAYAEQNLCFPGIVARTDTANQPSKALLRRLGFTFEKIEDKMEIWRYHSRS